MKLHPWPSGPGDLGEDVGCLALCKAESAVSQLLTQPQMLLRSPRDGPRLRAPKKYQAGRWTRSLPRGKGPQRPCTDLRVHSLCFHRIPSTCALTRTLFRGEHGGELQSWANRLNCLQPPSCVEAGEKDETSYAVGGLWPHPGEEHGPNTCVCCRWFRVIVCQTFLCHVSYL